MGITAPNPSAQTAVLSKAWKEAGIDPATLAYIETHGTGTKLGDPIEIEGISKAFEKYTDKKQFCAIGSVKTNIGHLYDCAGIAGLIKAALALKHQLLPPSIHFKTPNKQIPFIDSPVYINTSQKPWAQGEAPRRCGVSSFGLSGTNCHMVLEEYTAQAATTELAAAAPEQSYMIPLSAKSEEALHTLLLHMGEYFEGEQRASLKDISYTLAAGRDHHPLRLAFIATDIADLKQKLHQLIACRQHLTSLDVPWLSYGTSKLAGDHAHFAQLAEQLVKQLKTAAVLERPELLQQIAELYTAGAAIGWSAMYRGSRAKRAHIPVYPFERKRSWLQIPESAPAERANALFTR